MCNRTMIIDLHSMGMLRMTAPYRMDHPQLLLPAESTTKNLKQMNNLDGIDVNRDVLVVALLLLQLWSLSDHSRMNTMFHLRQSYYLLSLRQALDWMWMLVSRVF